MVCGILFRAAAETLRTIAADPKHLGADTGFFAVLHTWGQNLLHHPHLHCVVAGGGLSPDGRRWISCRPGFFLPVRVLSRLFRRLFLHDLQMAFDSGKLQFFNSLETLRQPPEFARYLAPLRQAEWVVFAKPPFAGPEQVLDYVHTLPDGFRRIRYYGFLAHRCRQQKLARGRQLLDMAPPPTAPAEYNPPADYRDRHEQLTGSSLRECPVCHRGRMLTVETLPPRKSPAVYNTS